MKCLLCGKNEACHLDILCLNCYDKDEDGKYTYTAQIAKKLSYS
jgi:hypothetical protein